MKVKVILIVILIFAAFLRFHRLNEYPALNADEAAIGYNVYSLIETGRDEHGNPWPVHFRSFDDYKPGGYFYIALPFIKLLGLSVWSVRLPGALFGVFSVLVMYFLTKNLLENFKLTEKQKLIVSLTSSFFIAISPWHIHFSRGAWEVNVSTFFIMTGVWLFLLWIRKESKTGYLLASVISFVLSCYIYHSARVIAPIIFVGLLVILGKLKRKNIKKLFYAAVTGLVFLLPLGMEFMKGSPFSRAYGVGIFSDPGTVERINRQRGEHGSHDTITAKIIHNKPVNYTLSFLENWSDHYHGEFLFLSGDEIERNKVPETGQMYLFDALFLTVGILMLLNKPKSRVLLFWLIIAPAASALTFQSPHALRSHNMIIPLVIISSLGLIKLSLIFHENIKSKALLNVIFVIFISVVSWNFTRYLLMYWHHMDKEYPFSSQYGLKELSHYLEKIDDPRKIVVSDRYDQPYILLLFYLKYPPEKYQNDHKISERDIYGFSTVESFGKYEFRAIDWEKDKLSLDEKILVGSNKEIPDEVRITDEIYSSNGYRYFKVVSN